MCDQQEALQILDEVYHGVSPILPIKEAYLYGSYARGDYDTDSDVDIFLTSPLSAEEISRCRRKISHVAAELSMAHEVVVSVSIRQSDAFQPEHHPYYENVAREGIRYQAEDVPA